MRNLIIALALMSGLSSCGLLGRARDKAIEYTLEPAVALAWGDARGLYSVRSDVVRGIDDAVEDGDLATTEVMMEFVYSMDTAIADGGHRTALRVIPWVTLREYAERGIQDRIDDGEIHELIAPSLLERLEKFSEAIDKLTEDIAINHRRLPRPVWRGHSTAYADGSVLTGTTLVKADGSVHTVAPVPYTPVW